MLCLGDTNRGTIYLNKVVGNSPELCRGLDSHGFKDLNDSIQYHTTLTSKYDVDDIRAFRMGTPTQVWSTMTRCWTVAPSSERIIEDISKFPLVLQKIVEAKGCIVHDENLRSGKRYVRVDKRGDCKRKPRRRQRKENFMCYTVHPDAFEARFSLQITHVVTVQ